MLLKTSKITIEFLESSVVTQTALGCLTIHRDANFL